MSASIVSSRPARTLRWRGGNLVLGAALACVGALAWLLVHGAPPVLVQRCVSPDPKLAWLGVHLALLRHDPGCGAGQLAFDPGTGHSMALVVMVAIPTVVANLLTALGLIGFWVALRRLSRRLTAAVRRVWPRLPGAPRAVLARREGRPIPFTGRVLRPWPLDRSPVLRRGPPARCAI